MSPRLWHGSNVTKIYTQKPPSVTQVVPPLQVPYPIPQNPAYIALVIQLKK